MNPELVADDSDLLGFPEAVGSIFPRHLGAVLPLPARQPIASRGAVLVYGSARRILCEMVFSVSLLRLTSLAFVSNANGVHVQDCAGLDWASRHRNRWRGGPAIARLRKLRAKLAVRRHKTSSYYRLAAAIAAAEDELLGSAKRVTRDLKRRERNLRHRS
jgi:hypothetical protein